MKSLLETGAPLAGAAAGRCHGRRPRPVTPPRARCTVASASTPTTPRGSCSSGGRRCTPDEADDLLGRAYAAAYHWRRATGAEAGERGAGGVARVARPRRARPRRRWRGTTPSAASSWPTAAGLADFDLAYAHEARRPGPGLPRPPRRGRPSRSPPPTPSRSPTPRTPPSSPPTSPPTPGSASRQPDPSECLRCIGGFREGAARTKPSDGTVVRP